MLSIISPKRALERHEEAAIDSHVDFLFDKLRKQFEETTFMVLESYRDKRFQIIGLECDSKFVSIYTYTWVQFHGGEA